MLIYKASSFPCFNRCGNNFVLLKYKSFYNPIFTTNLNTSPTENLNLGSPPCERLTFSARPNPHYYIIRASKYNLTQLEQKLYKFIFVVKFENSTNRYKFH